MWLYLYLTVSPELVNSSLSYVFLLVASCWIFRWLADFKSFWNLQVLGFSTSGYRFVLRLYISGRNHFLVVFDLYLILANCLVTSADVWWRFHWGDLRSVSQDSSLQSSQPTNNQFWLVMIFYLWSGCLRLEVFSASLFSVQRWVVSGKLACNTYLLLTSSSNPVTRPTLEFIGHFGTLLLFGTLLSENPIEKCVKLCTVAAYNNRVHMPWSLYYCLFTPHICGVVLRAHPVRGESHNQRNANGEVATLLHNHFC